MRKTQSWFAIFFTALLTQGCHMESSRDSSVEPRADGSSSDAAVLIQARIGSIDWYLNYDDAVKVAKREKKPLWVHFGENPG